MSYSLIEITEVGPAEFPLIQVLRDTIFGAYGHRINMPFAAQADGRQDLIALIAHLESNPVGFKVGYRDAPGVFYSWTGGVLPEYRASGVARRMQDYQHALLRGRGYRAVWFNTFNKFREMLRFGLGTGFVPIGLELQQEGEISIKFRKDLAQPEPARQPRQPTAAAHIESVGPNFHGLVARLWSQAGGRPTTEQQVDREMAADGALALIAYAGDEAVGCAVGRPTAVGELAGSAPGFEVRMLGVREKSRGRGLGAALLERVVEAGGGAASVRMGVPNPQTTGLRMAIGRGFDVVGMTHAERGRGPFTVWLERTGNSTEVPLPEGHI